MLTGIRDTSHPNGKIKYQLIADRWDRDHVYRKCLDAERKTMHAPLKWDAVNAMFDKSKRSKIQVDLRRKNHLVDGGRIISTRGQYVKNQNTLLPRS